MTERERAILAFVIQTVPRLVLVLLILIVVGMAAALFAVA